MIYVLADDEREAPKEPTSPSMTTLQAPPETTQFEFEIVSTIATNGFHYDELADVQGQGLYTGKGLGFISLVYPEVSDLDDSR